MDSNLIKKQKKFIIINSIWALIFIALLVLTIINYDRVKKFGSMFDSISSVVQLFGIAIYLVSLSCLVLYYIYLFVRFLIYKRKNEPWYQNLKDISGIHDILVFVLKSFSLILFFMIFIINPCRVVGSSMYQTFNDNDLVFCSDLFYSPSKNDVIVFDATSVANDEAFYIKRVIAKEDDVIYYKVEGSTGTLYVNGEKENRQNVSVYDYLVIIGKENASIDVDDESEMTYKIPKDKIVVLGDNRYNSKDSRYFGLIDEKDVYGKVIFRLYPFNKMSFF